MKRLFVLFLAIILIVSLVSCGLFGEEKVTTSKTQPTTTEKPIVTRPTTTSPSSTTTTTKNTTTTTGSNNDPVEDEYIYSDFSASEKQIMRDLFGEVIPFIPNDEYYFETYTSDTDDGYSEIGVNFYTYGNTKAEFDNYRSKFSSYVNADTLEEDGVVWYLFDAADDSYYIDMSYYEADDGYVVDVYAFFYTGGGSTDTSGHTYTAFTSSEKSLFNKVVGAVIPFIPNYEYYVDDYTESYDDGTTEIGINFYTYGNTQAEFDAYKSQFSSYVDSGSIEDGGVVWYFYDAADESYYVDMAYYDTDDGYVVDVYVYYWVETGNSDGEDDDNVDSEVDLITNAGAGLPTGNNGVFNVDFSSADYVKNVTEQGYYIDGCPTIGSPAVLVIPVEFSDCRASSKGYTTDALENAFKKNGITDYYSVYDYYFISSYGQLTLDVTVVDEWFCPKYDSSYYYNATYDYYGDEVAIGDQLVLDEALAYLAGTMDLSKYDSDNNGIIDAVVLINTLDVGEEDFYWAYRYWNIYTDDQDYFYEYDGVSANDYLWASYQFLNESYDEEGNVVYDDTSAMNTYTYIHEFGHILGLDDYYDTANVGSPLDGADMMDYMLGDHNAYSKFNLGWINTSRLVVTDTSVTLTLEDFSKNGDTIIIANNWNEKLGAYQEYYVLVYYTSNGLNSTDKNAGYFARDGVVVYHVNASLYKQEYDGEIYYDVYNNNTDVSDSSGYGTEDNLIEYVKSSNDTFTYVVVDTIPQVTDDNGEVLGYTFIIDVLTSDYVTITFTAK